jgi:hypothetical protein
MKSLRWFGAGALALAMAIPATAEAATLSVDDDKLDCPSAGYSSVQAAINDASPGDVVAICPGTYEEGPDTVPHAGANAVSIAKMLTIRGAGASKVTIKPKPTIASLLGTTTNYRNTTGAVIGVYRSGVRTLVDISGVTVEGGVTTVGSAVKFFNAEGSLTGSVIRNVAPLNAAQQGYGVVVASNLVADRLPVRVAGNAISGYAKAGVVLDSTQAAPALGVLAATINNNTITGAGTQVQTPQQGVLATGLVQGAISANAITNNFGAGDRASAGVRAVDLDLVPATGGTTTKLTATGNNIVGNGYGVVNETGAGADQALPFTATGNWWGHVAGPSIGLPKTVGDPVNGTSVTYTGFRTTAIAAPAVPTAVADARPTGEIDPPTASRTVVPGTTYTLRAVAADDFGVRSVEFAIDGVPLASDGTAPYSTAWTPPAALAGKTVTLSVTITDSAGQTTQAPLTLALTVNAPEPEPTPTVSPTATPTVSPTATPTPEPTAAPVATTPTPEPTAAPVATTPAPTVTPAALNPTAPDKVTLSVAAAKGRKLTLTGKLRLPQGFTCPSAGTISLSVSLGKTVVKRATGKLDASCGYTVKLALPKRASGRKVTVKARFLTAGSLLARSAPARTITVKR